MNDYVNLSNLNKFKNLEEKGDYSKHLEKQDIKNDYVNLSNLNNFKNAEIDKILPKTSSLVEINQSLDNKVEINPLLDNKKILKSKRVEQNENEYAVIETDSPKKSEDEENVVKKTEIYKSNISINFIKSDKKEALNPLKIFTQSFIQLKQNKFEFKIDLKPLALVFNIDTEKITNYSSSTISISI